MAELNEIRVRGARVHNLKNVSVELPRNQLVVLTGLSGSGKSSLAFDTIYAEGQRRYVESLSSYARQFLQMQDKPDVDLIEGLSPAISIEQKTTSKNPRSTVATVTEIYDYLRLLYARVGKVHCYSCDKPIVGRTASQIVDAVMALLRDLRKEGRVMLVATHNLGSVPEFCDRVVLVKGTVLAHGPTAEVFTPDNLREAFGGVLRHFLLEGQRLHDDEDPRRLEVFTDDERPLVIYDERHRTVKGKS